MYAIKAEFSDPNARSWTFEAQKTMYGVKHVNPGDTIFVFASEREGGAGLIASAVVSSAKATPRMIGIERQTPRLTITVNVRARQSAGSAGASSCPSVSGTTGAPRRN